MMRPLVNFRAIMPGNVRRRYVDDFFNDNYRYLTDQRRMEDNNITVPSANIREVDNGYAIELAAPGFNRDEFTVELDNDVLSINGERKIVQADDDRPYSRREHNYMSFSRSFALPDTVDEDGINANYENGILYVSIPVKSDVEQTRAPRRIDIG